MASAHTHSPRDPMLELYAAVRSAGRHEKRRDLAGESGYRLAVVLTLLFDGLTTAFLGLFLLIVAPQLIHARAGGRPDAPS